jgi:neurotransmitter:Na+ symporter, NSS family
MSTATAAPAREQWSGQVGFLLAAIGSAVGLGNIWRFPGVAYEYGGGAFLIPYLLALLTAGIPILLLDYSLGHRFRGSAPATFRRMARSTEPLGWFQVAITFVISVYYAVVIAWALRYAFFSANLAWGDDPVGFFTGDFLQVAGEGVSLDFVGAVLWPLLLVWVVCVVILALGIQNGLEKANIIFLPTLVLLFGGLVVRALFLDGAAVGLNSLFTPRWDALGDPQVWLAAYSQIFFSLSVAFGIMITYSSYLRRRANLISTGYVAAFANSSFEILAGIGVFATLGFMSVQANTPIDELPLTGVGLSFMAFPQIISMMPGGAFFGVLFFGSLVVAGITSLISVLQVISAAVQEKFRLSRVTAALAVGGFAGTVSVLLFSTTTGLVTLDTVDKFVNEIGIVTSAIVMTVVVAHVHHKLPELRAHLNAASIPVVGRWWQVMIAFVVPVVLVVMLGTTLWQLVSEGYEDYAGWFLAVFGWGTVAFLVVAAVALTLIPWRREVDAFEPDDIVEENR